MKSHWIHSFFVIDFVSEGSFCGINYPLRNHPLFHLNHLLPPFSNLVPFCFLLENVFSSIFFCNDLLIKACYQSHEQYCKMLKSFPIYVNFIYSLILSLSPSFICCYFSLLFKFYFFFAHWHRNSGGGKILCPFAVPFWAFPSFYHPKNDMEFCNTFDLSSNHSFLKVFLRQLSNISRFVDFVCLFPELKESDLDLSIKVELVWFGLVFTVR